MQTVLKNPPLVSCLCVTRRKVAKLKRAINCFLAQTYPNKELIILYEDDDQETKLFAAHFSSDGTGIYFVEVEAHPKLSLGELRNISVQKCNGEFFCQWDDDDWYNVNRITVQLEAAVLNVHAASILTNWLMLDQSCGKTYFSGIRLWEGSIMCRKDVVNDELKYPALPKSEDRLFIDGLLTTNRVFPVVAPNLYIYVYHGENTWDYEHFKMLFNNCKQLSEPVSMLIQDILDEKYSVAEGSALLDSDAVLAEIEYFYSYKINKSIF